MHENPQQNQDIEILIKNYGNDVLRTAYMYVKDIHTAEDIFQDVFIKVSQKHINQ
jgi:RNA polymerase sigma-70 factor, ECF subfamily